MRLQLMLIYSLITHPFMRFLFTTLHALLTLFSSSLRGMTKYLITVSTRQNLLLFPLLTRYQITRQFMTQSTAVGAPMKGVIRRL